MCRCDARDRRASIARMIAAAKIRLVHDPSVGVSDLMMPLKNMIASKDDRNIYKLVMPPPGVTWKSAAPVSWMANLSSLFKDYVKVAANSVVSSKKHKQALVRLDDTEKINFTRKVQADFVDAVDDAIRCGLAHFRTLKQMDDAKIRAFRKADEDQQKAIQEVLDLIQIEKGHELEVSNQQIVPATPAKTSSPSPANQPSSSTGFDAVRGIQVMDYESVFDAVVTGTNRSLEKDFEETEVGPNNCTITYFGKKDAHQQSEESPQVKKKQQEKKQQEKKKKDDLTPSPHKAGPFQLALTDSDRSILEKAQDASPIAKDGKTQQQRLNAQKPSKKGKGKGKAQEKQEKDKNTSSVLRKRPSTAMSVEPKDNKDTSKQLTRKQSSQQTIADPNSFELVLPEHLPDTAAGIPRGKARNAYVSWAYHHSKTAAKRTGCNDKETLAKVGQRAHAEAGKIFDQAWPKEGERTEEINQDQIKKKAKTGKAKKNKNDEKETLERTAQKEEEKTEKDATPRLRRRTKTTEASTEAAVKDVD